MSWSSEACNAAKCHGTQERYARACLAGTRCGPRGAGGRIRSALRHCSDAQELVVDGCPGSFEAQGENVIPPDASQPAAQPRVQGLKVLVGATCSRFDAQCWPLCFTEFFYGDCVPNLKRPSPLTFKHVFSHLLSREELENSRIAVRRRCADGTNQHLRWCSPALRGPFGCFKAPRWHSVARSVRTLSRRTWASSEKPQPRTSSERELCSVIGAFTSVEVRETRP